MFAKDKTTKAAAKLLDRLDEAAAKNGSIGYDLGPVKAITESGAEMQVAVALEAINRVARAEKKRGKPGDDYFSTKGFPVGSLEIADRLLKENLPFSADHYVFMLNRTADIGKVSTRYLPHPELLVKCVAKFAGKEGMSKLLASALGRMLRALEWTDGVEERRLRLWIERVIGSPGTVPLEPGEAWSDAALAGIAAMDDGSRVAWVSLLDHCQAASGGKPTAKWLKHAQSLLGAVGEGPFKECVLAWFPLLAKPRTAELSGSGSVKRSPMDILVPHADALKGLAWCCSTLGDREIAKAVTSMAVCAYKKHPGIGPRNVKIGNACTYALGKMPTADAVEQLALLKVKARPRVAQNEIEKALNAAAKRIGISREDLEEIGVPAYGLKEVGCLAESVGGFTAKLRVTGTNTTELTWVGPSGKEQKSVPAAVKKDHAEDLKELQTAAKDIQKMLPAQRERLDSLYLQRRSWPLKAWRERYLDHPLVGTLARRLIWKLTSGGRAAEGVFLGGRIVGPDDRPLAGLGERTVVELWHPIDCPADRITAWRMWLETHQVRQPFKQAHREVYPLTDAERQTRVYSNRYAAHIVKQHQFNALCTVRGWKTRLRLVYDGDYPPPSIDLPQWNLKVEFWTEGAGDELTDVGAYQYLSTDQVRFFALDACQAAARLYVRGTGVEPLPLAEIPPLAFSEVMRNADMFVGVASVGNDPTWSDGGPQGRYREYWADFSFGTLSATAETRRDVLQRLVPRLKIAPRCTFSDRFMVVRGDLRTYKIHLGSGNILMEPNDHYLCIVQKQRALAPHEELFLPFEGDQTMSIILSKAMLLADDTKIKDETILNQIRSK